MKNLSRHDAYYHAILTRDAKFDGKFFSGVKTTGIYCRPICPAKPKRENVEFFSSALMAEKAGYRPCLRCRPESAPDSPLWHGSSSIVRRALQFLVGDENAITLNEDQFADNFGMSARHLRRLFQTELGKTPAQIMRNNRLDLARKLIVETSLPFIDIAFSSGFDSVRRFNAAVRNRFSQTPSAMRKHKNSRHKGGSILISAAYRPPLDWQASLEYYHKHKIGELENFENGCYERIFKFNKQIGLVNIRNNAHKNRLDIELQTQDMNAISFVLSRVKVLFDLSLDPVYVANGFERAQVLKTLYRPYHGVRLARCWDRFELAVSTILGQLVSVKRATQLTYELMELYGEHATHPVTGKNVTLFPTAKKLASENLTALKVPRSKKIAINTLAQQVTNGNIHFSSYQDPVAFKRKLMQIHGIGKWTAEYVALRAIGDTDALPPGDAYLDTVINNRIDSECLLKLSPWRGYLATILYKYGAKV